MTMLMTTNLTVGIGKRILIRSLNWQVQRGEFWCVLGRNGSGKSTLLYTLSGLLHPVSGEIFLGQKTYAQMSANEIARYRGLVQQMQTDTFPHSVWDAVMAGRTPHRIGRSWDSEADIRAVHAALEQCELQDVRHSNVMQLSGGERQRVALAALIAQEPQLMLMDEPTAHQDVGRQVAILQMARDLSGQRAVIASCHDINLAARFATHVLILGDNQHWLGPVTAMLTPEILAPAFGCRFTVQHGVYIAH